MKKKDQFGETLWRLRRLEHLTRKELSEKAKISVTAIANYEYGLSSPTIRTAKKLLGVFNYKLVARPKE